MFNYRAMAPGIVTSIDIWANTNLTGCKVGSFYYGDVTTFQCRDFSVIGNVNAGSKQTFNVNFDVERYDLIGIYFTTGDIESVAAGGAPVYYKAGDKFTPGTSFAIDGVYGTDTLSLYATGTSLGIDVDVRVVKIEHKDMLNPSDMIIDFTNKLPDITDTLLGI